MRRFDNPLDLELADDAAAALGHAGRKLRKALDALEQFDAAAHDSSREEMRVDLVATAGEAFWSYVVQREALGLADAEYIAAAYRVPTDVRRAMGPRSWAKERAQRRHRSV